MVASTHTPDSEWFRSVVPDGLPKNASTVISGPGGSGKPLIGVAVVDSWLSAGGSVVVLLTNADSAFVFETMDRLYDVDRSTIEERTVFVDFDPGRPATLDALTVDGDTIAGNLLAPAVWEASIEASLDRAGNEGPGTLLFGSALNLFLFSPTYREAAQQAFVDTVGRTDVTSLFTVSTSAFREEIGAVEDAADTVLLTDMRDGTLRLRGERSESVRVTQTPVDVPFTEAQLADIKTVAERSRDTLIPTIKSV